MICFSQAKVEQIAFDYFFNEIFDSELKTTTKKIKFKGRTLNITSNFFLGVTRNCEYLNDEESLSFLLHLDFKKLNYIVEINDNKTNKIRKGGINSRIKKYKMNIYLATPLPNQPKSLVLITLTDIKRGGSIEIFYLIIENENVVGWCHETALT